VKVTAVLLGMHRAYLPPGAEDGRVTLDMPAGPVTPATVAAALGMPPDAARVVFRDGEAIATDHRLEDGDTVTFLWPVGGG